MKKPYKRPMSVALLKKVRYVTVQVPTDDGETEKVRVDTRKEISLTSAPLDVILQDHPQQAFFWNHARQATISRLRKAEEDYENTFRRYYLAYRHKFTEDGKSFTDKSLEAEAYTDDNVLTKRGVVNALRDQLGILTAICDALEHRRSMLIQISGSNRSRSF